MRLFYIRNVFKEVALSHALSVIVLITSFLNQAAHSSRHPLSKCIAAILVPQATGALHQGGGLPRHVNLRHRSAPLRVALSINGGPPLWDLGAKCLRILFSSDIPSPSTPISALQFWKRKTPLNQFAHFVDLLPPFFSLMSRGQRRPPLPTATHSPYALPRHCCFTCASLPMPIATCLIAPLLLFSDASRARLPCTGATRVWETLKAAVPPGSLAPRASGTPESRQVPQWSRACLLRKQCSSRQANGMRFVPGQGARRYGHLARQACIIATAKRADKANAVRRGLISDGATHVAGQKRSVLEQRKQ